MKEDIQRMYQQMMNMPQFREFVEQHKNQSTEQIAKQYDIKINQKQDG